MAAAAPTKKKRAIDDFELPDAVQVNRLEQERAGAAERVATFNSNFVPTGSAFKDTSIMSGTSRDVKRTREIDALLDKSSDRSVTMRGQNATYDLGLGELDVRRETNSVAKLGHELNFSAENTKTAAYSKGIDKQFELGKGELDLNNSIFNQTTARYNKYGETADRLNIAGKALELGATGDDLGYEDSDFIKSLRPQYLANKEKAAAPAQMITEEQTQYNKVPEQFAGPITGIPTFAEESRGISPIFQAANLGVMAGTAINRAVAKPRSSIRRRVKKGY